MSDGPTVVGRMIVELHANGPTGRPTPSVVFDPPGVFTPGMLYEYQQLMAAELQKAHASVRHFTRTGEVKGVAR